MSLIYYMINATGGERVDFKRWNTGGKTDPKYSDPENHYRGMPILGLKNGKQIYASARDVGNIAAGLLAGYNNAGWEMARLPIDGLQTLQAWQSGRYVIDTEDASTKYAQKLGYRLGKQLRLYELIRQGDIYIQMNYPYLKDFKINKDVIDKSEYVP